MLRLRQVLDSWKPVLEDTAIAMEDFPISHRAQFFVYLHLKGIVPATTRRPLAKAQA